MTEMMETLKIFGVQRASALWGVICSHHITFYFMYHFLSAKTFLVNSFATFSCSLLAHVFFFFSFTRAKNLLLSIGCDMPRCQRAENKFLL